MVTKKLPACNLSTIINRQYMTVRLIGKGSYGMVFEALRLNSPSSRFAVKVELAATHNNLKGEWNLMKLLKESNARHSIKGVELGCQRNFNYIVMELVGPSLSELRKCSPKKKFTLYTTVVCGIQCFDSIVEIQKLGYIHRDVKPSNFAIGILGSEDEKLVHVLDFGLCRNIYNKNKELRKRRVKAPFRGTVNYCSLNIHFRMEPGRHDDFWSLLFVLIEFHLGFLPWDKMPKENVKTAKEKQTDELLGKCPEEFKMIRCLLSMLSYSKVPDYERLRGVLCQLWHNNQFTPDKPLDWQAGGEYESIFRHRSRPQNNPKKLNLIEIINIPNAEEKKSKYALEDFPKPGEQEPSRDESVSNSDDTIVEKEGPPPAPKHISRPVVPIRDEAARKIRARIYSPNYSSEQPTQKMDMPTQRRRNNTATISGMRHPPLVMKKPPSGASRASKSGERPTPTPSRRSAEKRTPSKKSGEKAFPSVGKAEK